MTTQEFSNEFDILYNNIMSNAAPGINEYEKSVLLTKAQSEIIKNYFNPLGNKYGDGFDDSPKRQIDFSKITKVATLAAYTGTNPIQMDERSSLYTMPTDVMFILNENITITCPEYTLKGTVVPISYDEYARLISKPYKLPLKNQAWRLINQLASTTVEIIAKSNATLSNYRMRYIKRPSPIVLVNLADEAGDLSIEGISVVTECELDPILHPEILQRAVELAKATYEGSVNSIFEEGKRSE